MTRGSTDRRATGHFPLLALLSLALATPALAATYRVGAGGAAGGCTHASIQAAIDAASANPGPDTVLIARNTSWTAQALVVNTPQELTLQGGYDTCATATPNGNTTLDGNGGSAQPVLRILAATGAIIRLSRLFITGGDHAGSGDGGGIFFEGNGRLEIADSVITQNTAGYGGGLYARGTGTQAEVIFGQNVVVSSNTARYSGGGVYINELEFAMRETGSIIMWNTAQGQGGTGGYGGGLMLRSGNLSAYAYLGPGVTSLGAIFANTAVHGGGVAVVGQDTDDDDHRAVLYTGQGGAEYPVRIRGNTATARGGGLYLRGWASNFSGSTHPYASLWNTEINENQAPDGAAIYADTEENILAVNGYSRVFFNSRDDGPPPCPSGRPCGSISDNRTATIDNQPTDGAIIRIKDDSWFDVGSFANVAGGIVIEGNRGGSLISAGHSTLVHLQNTLVVDNTLSGPMIRVGGRTFDYDRLHIIDSTVAGNEIGGHMLVIGERAFLLRRSILWQPGVTILQCNGCERPFGTFDRIIASERASLDGGNTPDVLVAAPRFVDPASGDYRLRAGSPAVDFTVPVGGDDRDVFGMPRDQRLPMIGRGTRDLGALERQSLMPLLHNGDFDSNLHAWQILVPGAVTRDTAQNASGPAGSGSLYVNHSNLANPRVVAAKQCIHLPAPGRYRLNAWGRADRNLFRDRVTLAWELRLDGNEDCSGGGVVEGGDHDLTSANSWNRPAQAVTFDVDGPQWTPNTSLAVYAVVTDLGSVPAPGNGVVGWIDGVTLAMEPLGDLIFADGFDGLEPATAGLATLFGRPGTTGWSERRPTSAGRGMERTPAFGRKRESVAVHALGTTPALRGKALRAPVIKDAAVAQVVLERGLAAQRHGIARPQQQAHEHLAVATRAVELRDGFRRTQVDVGRQDIREMPTTVFTRELVERPARVRPATGFHQCLRRGEQARRECTAAGIPFPGHAVFDEL